MRCKTCGTEVSDAEILSHAGRIRSRMRKQRRGAAPGIYACRFCNASVVDKVSLALHERTHFTGELVEVTADDLKAMAWEPDTAA